MSIAHLIESLDLAAQRATTCIVNLQAANSAGTAVQAITTLRLIEDAARLRNQIVVLRDAIEADAREATPADEGPLRAAVEDVLLGSRLDAHGNRNDDGLQDFAGREATEHQIDDWTTRLQDGLDGKTTKVR
jgi:hypothetical protein